MIHIQKGREPQWLKDYKEKNPQSDYDTESFQPFHSKLREKLVEEQNSLCAYCCKRIHPETSHNEHIEPRHPKNRTSRKTLDYSNIVASCNQKKTCGSKKGNEYDESKFVSPLQPECEKVFSYYPDGIIDGDDYTISLLNLNDSELRGARRAVYKSLMKMDYETIKLVYCQPEQEELPPFYNVIQWYLSTVEEG
ncbi:MAG: retron system putative HNH endonuclease [Lachnospiraceae bacterium]|nr:retron system putative HNH endonuclease [Lachnospiraceae bacterium]